MKKIERGMAFVAKNLALFRCPVCHRPFLKVEHQSVFCSNKHNFDFGRKGTLYLVNHGLKSDYDDDKLWAARRILQQAGLFKHIVAQIGDNLPIEKPLKILDIGCGEGSTLHLLEQQRHQQDDALVGFDISKRALNRATQLETAAFFCVADLARLPFQTASFDVLLDLFSPSAYEEFERVLKSGGHLFKIVPNSEYLQELRHSLYVKEDPRHNYSNEKVVTLFKKNYPQGNVQRIKYEFPLNKALFENLMYMTPLHWGATQAQINESLRKGLDKITIDVSLLSAKKE